jgi:heme-degrading monooxygenase HmoA
VVARIWRARATPEGAAAYRQHFEQAVCPELQPLDGYRGAYLLSRDGSDALLELQVVTLWDSLDAVRRFAGPVVENAVVEPAARAALTSYDTTVTHHVVVVDAWTDR